MDPLHLAHLFFILVWLGLIFGETAMEIAGRERAFWPALARFHYLIDVYIEMPLIVGIVVTGALLLLNTAPDMLLWIKLADAAVAIAANLACFWMVVVRARRVAVADEGFRVWTAKTYFRLLGVGFPFGILALVLGAHRMNWC